MDIDYSRQTALKDLAITRWPAGPIGNSKSFGTISNERGAGLPEFLGVSPNCSLTGNWCRGMVP